MPITKTKTKTKTKTTTTRNGHEHRRPTKDEMPISSDLRDNNNNSLAWEWDFSDFKRQLDLEARNDLHNRMDEYYINWRNSQKYPLDVEDIPEMAADMARRAAILALEDSVSLMTLYD
ncbi:hypothetical protein ACI65C_006359 [Semiaphis heraclei]